MKTTYGTTNSNTLIPIKPPRTVECIIIRNYPTKYAKVFKVFKEFLDSTPHITKYFRIKSEKPIRYAFSRWDFYNVKPENVYVFQSYMGSSRFSKLLQNIRAKCSIIQDYVIFPILYIKSDTYPLEYYCGYGSLLVDECNLEYISE